MLLHSEHPANESDHWNVVHGKLVRSEDGQFLQHNKRRTGKFTGKFVKLGEKTAQIVARETASLVCKQF